MNAIVGISSNADYLVGFEQDRSGVIARDGELLGMGRQEQRVTCPLLLQRNQQIKGVLSYTPCTGCDRPDVVLQSAICAREAFLVAETFEDGLDGKSC
jgi:hypothetical protein